MSNWVLKTSLEGWINGLSTALPESQNDTEELSCQSHPSLCHNGKARNKEATIGTVGHYTC